MSVLSFVEILFSSEEQLQHMRTDTWSAMLVAFS